MILGNTFFRDGKVIIADVDGSEVAFLPQDIIELMQWIYDNYAQLQSLSRHKPPMFTREQTLDWVQRHKEGE